MPMISAAVLVRRPLDDNLLQALAAVQLVGWRADLNRLANLVAEHFGSLAQPGLRILPPLAPALPLLDGLALRVTRVVATLLLEAALVALTIKRHGREMLVVRRAVPLAPELMQGAELVLDGVDGADLLCGGVHLFLEDAQPPAVVGVALLELVGGAPQGNEVHLALQAVARPFEELLLALLDALEVVHGAGLPLFIGHLLGSGDVLGRLLKLREVGDVVEVPLHEGVLVHTPGRERLLQETCFGRNVKGVVISALGPFHGVDLAPALLAVQHRPLRAIRRHRVNSRAPVDADTEPLIDVEAVVMFTEWKGRHLHQLVQVGAVLMTMVATAMPS
mmetsp:Transcript_41317/g.103114  ORF Transcript_41317/g.103114 Transcript_41317/m.103114 type:complete len:334 (+) Transcript_41317:545-1546(+)